MKIVIQSGISQLDLKTLLTLGCYLVYTDCSHFSEENKFSSQTIVEL